MDPAARDAYDDTLRQAIDAGDSFPPDAKLAGAVAAYRRSNRSLLCCESRPTLSRCPKCRPNGSAATFMNPDSVYGKLVCLAISSVFFSAAVVFVAAAVAPAFHKIVAVAAAGIVLFSSGFAAYPVVLESDWWAAYQVVWANIGAITTACHGVDAG